MKKKPSVLDMIKTFAEEVKNYAKEGAPNVSEEGYAERLETCNACEHLKRDVMRCGLCGCLVEHKAKWATSSCPDSRWKKQVIGEDGKRVSVDNMSSLSERKQLKLKRMVEKRKKRDSGSQNNTTETGD